MASGRALTGSICWSHTRDTATRLQAPRRASCTGRRVVVASVTVQIVLILASARFPLLDTAAEERQVVLATVLAFVLETAFSRAVAFVETLEAQAELTGLAAHLLV